MIEIGITSISHVEPLKLLDEKISKDPFNFLLYFEKYKFIRESGYYFDCKNVKSINNFSNYKNKFYR